MNSEETSRYEEWFEEGIDDYEEGADVKFIFTKIIVLRVSIVIFFLPNHKFYTKLIHHISSF